MAVSKCLKRKKLQKIVGFLKLKLNQVANHKKTKKEMWVDQDEKGSDQRHEPITVDTQRTRSPSGSCASRAVFKSVNRSK